MQHALHRIALRQVRCQDATVGKASLQHATNDTQPARRREYNRDRAVQPPGLSRLLRRLAAINRYTVAINRYTVAFDNGEVHSYSNESVVKLRVALTQVTSEQVVQ
jgi:hypothetical protein